MAGEPKLSQLKVQMDTYRAENKAVHKRLDEKLDKLQSSIDSLTTRFDEQMTWLKERFGENSDYGPISEVPARFEVGSVVDVKDKEILPTAAKNLALAGVKSVTLHDEGKVELWDLSSNFIFSEVNVGKNRALASVQKLQELNNVVVISTLTTELKKEHLSDFQVVVFTDISLEKAIEFDDFCHKHQPPIAFIKADVGGLFGYIRIFFPIVFDPGGIVVS